MVPRPEQRRAADAGRSRLGDAGRRGPRSDRISTRRSGWLFAIGGLAVAAAIAAALFGLPVRTWFEQDDQIRALEHELDEVQAVNEDLGDEVSRLQTEEGIEEAARDELGQIRAGDRRLTVGPIPPLPRAMPNGWPYVLVDRILTMRAAEVAAATAAPTTAGATSPSTTAAGTTTVP